ncbi:hypothetical protein LRS13_09275 [Svornostia abyssi]|uniref:Uncharacterized protein n=1 Tax=Svornostia abyssi TaxID=2898438 RepID=A0ABY5PM18_9ACTN|nr:hypothetical protein LRS13_09275 [Parviterribacteraceae bacterium J379]
MLDRRLASALAAIVLLPAGLSTPRSADPSTAVGCQPERAPGATALPVDWCTVDGPAARTFRH